jgi:3-oxoacyl-[acyl-carrier protein] reductase
VTKNGHEGAAVVTGASRGIGAAIARALAADGWPVAVNYRNGRAEAEAVVSEIEAAGGRAIPVQGDVADPAATEEIVATTERELAPVLVLVNNAGVTGDGPSMTISDDAWRQVVETNLFGAFWLTRRVLRRMMRVRYGRIVNIASVVGQRGSAGQASYGASKAGLIGFTQSVAVEVARKGVTVNAVAPGWIETDMTAGLPSEAKAAIPARRAGAPADVAGCVRFLASDAAAYVTGTTLNVDGGLAVTTY